VSELARRQSRGYQNIPSTIGNRLAKTSLIRVESSPLGFNTPRLTVYCNEGFWCLACTNDLSLPTQTMACSMHRPSGELHSDTCKAAQASEQIGSDIHRQIQSRIRGKIKSTRNISLRVANQ
jgi:hypothetical protein